jgi:Fic family protein
MESKLQFDFSIQQIVLRKIAGIDAFQSRWQIEQADEKVFLKDLKAQTLVQSTGSSTRIEGSTLTNQEVETLLKNMKITLKRDLSILVERRLLTQVGKGRGVRYFAAYKSLE